MKTKLFRPTLDTHSARGRVAILLIALLAFGDLVACARQESTPAPTAVPPTEQQAPSTEQQAPDAPKIPNDQLDSLVAPIALYPDPLLSQVLVASTYPLEIVQLQQWLEKRGNFLNEKARTEEVQKQNWDPSIQAMAVLPDVAKRMSENVKWTSDLGNAFLAQQADVMDAVQRMRATAQNKGNLQSNEQMKVETKQVESKTVVIIQQANPEVVYVPSYNPTVVWGAMSYPYPPVYYPPAGYYAGRAIGFGVGVAIGAAWGGGGWGWGCGWGHNDVNINVNNNFVRNSNINNANFNRNNTNINRNNTNINRSGGNTWQHNPQHRGGAPYSNKATATKYGGSVRGDSLANRQATARQNSGQFGSGGGRQAGSMDRSSGGRQAGSMDRSSGSRQASSMDRTSGSRQAGSMDRTSGGRQASSMDRSGSGRSSSGFGGGGGDRIGSRETSRSSGSSNRNGGSFGSNSSFGGGSFGGGSARSSSSRGSSSMGSRGGGGGGFRGGGGRRR